jgi:hypothetical protein
MAILVKESIIILLFLHKFNHKDCKYYSNYCRHRNVYVINDITKLYPTYFP